MERVANYINDVVMERRRNIRVKEEQVERSGWIMNS